MALNNNLLNAIMSPGSDPQSESYAHENGAPSKDFKDEVRKYLRENGGVQMAFREEQVENEGDSGISNKKNSNVANLIYIVSRVLSLISREPHPGRWRTK